ncbi:N-acetylglucosamine-6-phosphate deacetylase [Ceratobasidium theobromae]|uniref:N-acetylglucosamine-6-phosphate deacetylase n=1 Tax=Ceratobasidium theobromae TaxID=1582974 RepID=A0A5N5QJA5_9AGAM|nr:N-acetylglucosamine-6-phosphate deacetylase [Ceratobasidium theobromae]
MATDNNLVCFTNCLLALEDGSLVSRDLWVDSELGLILDAQHTFFATRTRPSRIIDLNGAVLAPGLLDIQINGAFGVDFSIYNDNKGVPPEPAQELGADRDYVDSLIRVADRIVETGVTGLVPTIVTQQRDIYPKLLSLLSPRGTPRGAHLLGWHAEGPFLQPAKRGAHTQSLLLSAPEGITTLESVYGTAALSKHVGGVRMITAAPEVEGIISTVAPLSERGVVFSIGHSIAPTPLATAAVARGARLITHLFNAMPQLHHRDPSIIGLLGSSKAGEEGVPKLSTSGKANGRPLLKRISAVNLSSSTKIESKHGAEALHELITPPQTPLGRSPMVGPASTALEAVSHNIESLERPFYGMIVDGIHSHPNSVKLAYTAHPEGCILVTDAMSMLDPHLPDGVHEWRDGKRLVKEGDKLFIEGTDTLAGSVVTLPKCIRNFMAFTYCTLGQAVKCATYNPAKCLGIEARKGTLRAGADADLVVMTPEGEVLSTWVSGKQVWSKSG